MKREILFRGKRVDNGSWEYGDFRIQNDDNPDRANYLKTYIKPRNIVNRYEVIPETVGQLTGLTDKNGTKIFEGDILRNEKNMVYAGSYNFECIFENAAFVFLCEKYGVAAYSDDAENLEIIGNIHDNPELSEQNYEKEKQEE